MKQESELKISGSSSRHPNPELRLRLQNNLMEN